MGSISKITSGSLAKSNKVNEIIKKVNAIENMTIRGAVGDEPTQLTVSDNDSELVTSGGGGGGGLPDGYVETDVILCVNGSPVNGQILFYETTTP